MLRFAPLLLTTTALAGAGCDVYRDMYGTWTYDEPISHVSADIDASDLLVVPATDGRSRVDLDIEYTDERPRFDVWLEGATLHVDLDCYDDCRGLIKLRVPAIASIDADLGAGSIDIDGIDGDIVASSGAGAVEARNLGATSCEARSSAGSVKLSLTGDPTDVVAESAAGNVSVTVPAGTYDVEASSSAGDTSIDGLIDNPSAPNSIYAHSDAGNVSVKGI